MNAPVEYIPNFVDNPDEHFTRLQTELNWIRYTDVPRSEYFYNKFDKPYSYGRGRGKRTYQPQAKYPSIDYIQSLLEKHLNVVFDVCFLNRYHNQSDQLGWHSDDSPEMDDERPIITVSLGVEREIWFRKDPNKFHGLDITTQKQKLEHGSALVMLPHMQETWQHRIPKASFICGERISLTFRGYNEQVIKMPHTKNKTEWEVNEIVKRFGCTREDAENAPDNILSFFSKEQPKLSKKDLEHAQKVIKEYNEGKRKPIAVITRRSNKPKVSN